MQISEVSIVELLPADYNPRRISAQQMQALERSMREFGVVDPFIVNADNTLIGGHQRLLVAQKLGLETVPVVYVDLDKDREKALNLALNKISGEWDEAKLEALLAELQADDVDLALTGFSEDELAALLGGQTEAGLTDPDDVPEPPAEPTSKPGDLWLLGEHRVLCGDCTDPANAVLLMNGAKAHICWTDPPWNVAYGESKNPRWKMRSIENDNLGADFPAFATKFCSMIAEALQSGALLYMAMSAQEWPTIDGALRTAGFHWSSTIIWAKDRAVLSRKDYHTRYEPLWYGWREGAARLVPLADRKQDDVWDIARPTRSDEHPTMKPVELVARALLNSSRSRSVVLDPFLGSGTTLIAAEQTGRVCYGMEIDPVYVDVIVRRWEEFTGKKAVLHGNPRP